MMRGEKNFDPTNMDRDPRASECLNISTTAYRNIYGTDTGYNHMSAIKKLEDEVGC